MRLGGRTIRAAAAGS